MSSKSIAGNGTLTVRVNVRNTGRIAGDEVPQLYVRDVQASVKRPKLEKLAFWDEATHTFLTEPGTFEVLVGRSSQDIRLRARFDVTSAGHWPY